jgi:1,4-dihydroxy-6-naphthoate synthase
MSPDVRPLTLGYSPCPNDTFVFHALVHGLVPSSRSFEPRLEDVETLNRLALEGRLDVTKVSYGVLPFILHEYALLRSGGALGRGCGPLLVVRENTGADSLRGGRIGVPGRYTTANLLLRLYDPDLSDGVELEYSEIMPAVAKGELDAGLIIHESRFTYPEHGLRALVDLGAWWEEATGTPIPLGAIVARRSLGDALPGIEEAIRTSVARAHRDPVASEPYVAAHAQEMSPEVRGKHIDLYVNAFTTELGPEGEAAVLTLVRRAADAGLIPSPPTDPFGGGGGFGRGRSRGIRDRG